MEKASKTYPKADILITVSPALKKVIEKNFNVVSTYIPNTVDTSIFKYLKQNNTCEFTFVTVGNLIPRKQMDLTVRAFTEAFRNDKNVNLIVIGEGEDRKKLESIIKKEKMEKSILLTGRLDRNDISEQFNKSNCFVLPSRAETFGVVYIEAMASGLPVIATKCGGPEAFIKDNNGVLIDIDNYVELVNAMRFIYENHSNYNRKDISREAHKQFSPENIANEIENLYRKILK